MPAAPSAQFSPTPRPVTGARHWPVPRLLAGGRWRCNGSRASSCGWQRLAGVPGCPYSAAPGQAPGGSSGIASEATNQSLSVGQRHFLPTGRVVFHVKHKPSKDPLVLNARRVGTSTWDVWLHTDPARGHSIWSAQMS